MPCCTPAEPTYSAAVDADTELLRWQNPHHSSKMHNAFSFQCNQRVISVLSSHLTAASLSVARLSCLPSAFQSRQSITVLPAATQKGPGQAKSLPLLVLGRPAQTHSSLTVSDCKCINMHRRCWSLETNLLPLTFAIPKGHNYWLPVHQSWGCQPCNNAMKAEVTTRREWQVILARNCRLKHISSGGEQTFAEKLFATHLQWLQPVSAVK